MFFHSIFLWAIVRYFLKLSRKVNVRVDEKNRVRGNGGENVLIKESFESFPKRFNIISHL